MKSWSLNLNNVYNFDLEVLLKNLVKMKEKFIGDGVQRIA